MLRLCPPKNLMELVKEQIVYLLTEWEVRTEKYLARGQDVRTKRSEVLAF